MGLISGVLESRIWGASDISWFLRYNNISDGIVFASYRIEYDSFSLRVTICLYFFLVECVVMVSLDEIRVSKHF